jgi:hypothetical protein
MVEERQITVYARVQVVRPPVWVKDIKKMSLQSQAQLVRESASRITQIMAFDVSAGFRKESKPEQQKLLMQLAYARLLDAEPEDARGFKLEKRHLLVGETSLTAYERFTGDVAYMSAILGISKSEEKSPTE